MANLGAFDSDLRALAWLDPTAVAVGWYDYGMPFEHELIDSGVVVVDTAYPAYHRICYVFEEVEEEISW